MSSTNINSWELVGTLTSFSLTKSGQGKSGSGWKIYNGTIAVSSYYNNKKETGYYPFQVWNQTGDLMINIPIGSKIRLSGKITSREYNGKVYITLTAINFSLLDASSLTN